MKNPEIEKITNKIIDATMSGASKNKLSELIAESIKIIDTAKEESSL